MNDTGVARAIARACGVLRACGVRALPADPLTLAEKLGYRTTTYAALAEERGAPLYELRKTLPADAFTRGGGIWYDDTVRSRDRVRFSLLHEIAHNVLDHGSRPASDRRAAEAEANAFARTVLLPVPVLDRLRGDPRDSRYARLFCMSDEAWRVRLETADADRALLSAEEAERTAAQFHDFMYGRQCLRCGRVFTDGARTGVCPDCGGAALAWRPLPDGRPSPAPAMAVPGDLKPRIGLESPDVSGYWESLTGEKRAERRIPSASVPGEDAYFDALLDEYLEGAPEKKLSGAARRQPSRRSR